ncbi:MAG: alpha/beta fold hydrolase, partial [Porticoccaceae bacterium]|nr:alpha/beta fold hydrolase [Porticoccaceae bacterium]
MKYQLSALLRITKVVLATACALLISACLISIDTVNHYVDDVVTAEQSTLVRHTVVSEGHPMALWEKPVGESKGVILFVHGRTWSGLPDFDLQVEGEDISLMDGMVDQGYGTYAVDLRGYGETPRDASQWLSPKKAANDVVNVVRWISQRHGEIPVHIFGWSYGSVISLLASQIDDSHMASLTLFGFWLDLDAVTIEPSESPTLEWRVNTAEAAASDFIVPGSISQSAIDGFVTQALAADPVRVDWRYQDDFLTIDPTQINTPVLLLQGEFDPLTPTASQSRLFTRLKTADKRWVVISGGDHAAF